jgi:PGF-pre-PGF domain-containing protein
VLFLGAGEDDSRMMHKILFPTLFFIVLTTAVGAATVSVSSVDLLSENPHEKNLYSISIRVSYSISDASSCQAQVSTLPSGWLVGDGYQGGTYKTISCSGTTTTFDIMPTDLTTPTIAVEVKGDSTSDTKTMTDSVTVKNQPVLDLATDPSSTSVTKGSSITLDYVVQNTGDPSDTAPTESAILSIDSTSDWVTFSGGGTTLTVGTGTIDPGESVSDSTTLQISSSASISSISYTITASASNTVQTSVDTGTLSCTDCVTSGDPGGDGGGGGGGGANISLSTSTSRFWDVLPAGEQFMDISSDALGIKKLAFVASAQGLDVNLRIESLVGKPSETADISRTIERYLKISADNMPVLTGDVKIEFFVTNDWMAEKGADASDIVLMRYSNGAWNDLPTTIVGSSADRVTFEAVSPAFSYFAIAAPVVEEPVVEEEAVVEEAEAPESTGEAVSEAPEEAEGIVLQQEDGLGRLGTIVLVVGLSVFICGVAVAVYEVRKHRRKWTEPEIPKRSGKLRLKK